MMMDVALDMIKMIPKGPDDTSNLTLHIVLLRCALLQ